MTVLSRAFIRRMIIQEMRKPPLSSGLTFDDEDSTINIDDDTEIDDIPSFMGDDEDIEDLAAFDALANAQGIDQTLYRDNPDYRASIDDFGFDDTDDDDDFEFEFESETEEDSESETEYNPGRQVMDMSGDEIRRHVMSQADKLSPDMRARDMRTRAQMQYDDLVKQGRESEMDDPEFMDTAELPPYNMRRKKLKESIARNIRQSIRKRLLLL